MKIRPVPMLIPSEDTLRRFILTRDINDLEPDLRREASSWLAETIFGPIEFKDVNEAMNASNGRFHGIFQ